QESLEATYQPNHSAEIDWAVAPSSVLSEMFSPSNTTREVMPSPVAQSRIDCPSRRAASGVSHGFSRLTHSARARSDFLPPLEHRRLLRPPNRIVSILSA